ncbi:MAG: hypothetical protein QY310_14630 [Candidatus Jettenia sp. CY-1]|nr:MAG: hypothetical protein QY310_14630 [Candidatus Jettenia sp. CY-1]
MRKDMSFKSFKSRTEFFSKNLFYFLIAASLAIHALIILLSPQTHRVFNLSPLRESFIREPSEYTVALEVESADTEIEQISDTKQKGVEKEQEKEPGKKKYKIFTDTSDNIEDEETKVDTDKIGEKGSIAKDNFPDDKQTINNEPHAEGHSDAPLLGKGTTPSPADAGQQLPQEIITQAFIPGDSSGSKNSPPMYANVPKGLMKQQNPSKSSQIPQPKVLSEEIKEKTAKGKTFKPSETMQDETIQAEDALQTPKRERLTMERSIDQEEAEPLADQEGILFAEKQNEVKEESEIEKEPLPPLQEQKKIQEEIEEKEEKQETKEDIKTEKFAEKLVETQETIDSDTPKPDTSAFPSEVPDREPQREFERGLDEQERPGESEKPKVSFNVHAKKEGSSNEPILFEDTISNSAIPGAPSFNVKKHEYADYFKHIRDRVSLYWFLGYGTRAEIKLETKNDKPIVIEFKVLPNGSIDDVKILDDAGNFPLASRLIFSVKNAAPLNPFPSNIKEPSIDVKFNFYFF